MTFSGITFLYFFLPLTLLCHSLAPSRWRNTILLTASLVFFGWVSPLLPVFLLIGVLTNFLLGYMLDRQTADTARRITLTAGICLSFVPVLAQVLLSSVIPAHLAFAAALYCIRSITYLTEVYRRESPAQMSFSALGVYMAVFPCIAGPIVRYGDIRPALARRSVDTERSADGIWCFCLGLGKTVLLAGKLYDLWLQAAALAAPGAAAAWLGVFSFFLAFWLGFSGCCDMAVGLGAMLGFDLPENFSRPMSALSLQDFCRRWNTTLFSWIQDYVLQLFYGRRSKLSPAVVILLSVLCSFFYGGRPTVLLWGLFVGLLLAGELFLWNRAAGKLHPVFCRIFTLLAVTVSFVFFSSGTFTEAALCFAAMFGLNGHGTGQAAYLFGSHWLVLLLAIFGMTRWPGLLFDKLSASHPALVRRLRPAVILLLLVCCTAYMV